MRSFAFALVAILACSSSDSEVEEDARVPADASMDARTSAGANLDARVQDAAVNGDAGCDPGARGVVTTLDALCAMLEADGRIHCPRTRADYARSIDCRQFTFPSLRRHCDFDVSEFARADGLAYSWTFDRDSGALVHAAVIGDFACGSSFSTGRPWPSCDRNEQTCGLCEGGTDRAAQCPADVVAVIPNVDCPPSMISACFCGGGTTLPGSTLPDNGTLCAPACDDCEDGTCFSSCICSSDGQFRQRLQCTE